MPERRKIRMCEKIATTKMLHEEWLTLRKTWIGGSDAGAKLY